jgi:hypothetical protein
VEVEGAVPGFSFDAVEDVMEVTILLDEYNFDADPSAALSLLD